MTGWIGFVALAIVTGAFLVWRRVLGGGVSLFAGAALMLGAAGYAWQGRPDAAGSPVAAAQRVIEVDPAIVALRGAMTQRFGPEAQWLVMSDALLRSGSTRTAIIAIRSGIADHPRSVLLWTALGSALVDHDGGAISPAAQLAFEHAAGLDRTSPAPWFFLGLAQVRANDPAAAERSWTRALALTPPAADYRAELALRLEVLRRLIELRARGEVAAPPPAS